MVSSSFYCEACGERKEAQGLLNINNTWRPSCLLVRRGPCATETDLKVHEGETKITKNLGHLLRSGDSLRVRRLRTRGPTQMEDGGGTMDDGPWTMNHGWSFTE